MAKKLNMKNINDILAIFKTMKLDPKKKSTSERGKLYVFEYDKYARKKILKELEQKFKTFTNNVKYNEQSGPSSVGQLEIEGYIFRVTPKKGAISDGTHYEHQEIMSLNEQLTKIKYDYAIDYVPINYKGKIYLIKGCAKTNGTPKSDFHLYDKNNQPILHISHKAGSTAASFQQWGGISEKYPIIHNDPLVKKFISKMKAVFGDSLKNGDSVYSKDISDVLCGRAVYGPDYKRGPLGIENVHYVLQGTITLKQKSLSKIEFELKASSHELLNGDAVTGTYAPVLGATFRNGRKLVDIQNCRAGIYPFGFRKWKQEI